MLKEISIYLTYAIMLFLFNLSLSVYYSNDIIYILSKYLNEGLIIHDFTIWVWALWYTALFFSFWFTIPYIIYLIYVWSKNVVTKSELVFLKLFIFLLGYTLIFSIFIFITDLFVAGFFIPDIKKIVFEFQPELEKYLLYIYGLFSDLYVGFILLQIYFYVIINSSFMYTKPVRSVFFIYVFTFFLGYYWFGADGLMSDCFLFLTLLLVNQILIFFVLFLKTIKRYKTHENLS